MGKEDQPNLNQNQIFNGPETNFNVTSGGKDGKKGKKKTALVIVAIILIVGLIAGLVYCFTINNKPDKVYKKLVGSTIDSYTNEMKNMNDKTSKTSLKLSANVDTDKIDKKVIDLINKINIAMDVQTDNENQQFIMNVKADYDKEDLLDVQMYSNVKEEKTYMQLKNFLDKYIEIEDMDEEFYTYFKEVFKKQKMTAEQQKSLEKAMNILKKEVTNVIKEQYCTAEKEDIIVNGKTIATTKNTIKMNEKQLKEEFTNVFKNLNDNQEFINCFEEKDEVSKFLERFREQMEDLEEDEKSTIEMAVYTTGLMHKVQKFTLVAMEEGSNETVTVAFTNTAKDTYDFEILEKKNTVCKGTIKVEKKNKQEGNIHVTIEVEDFGKLNLNIEYSQKFNEDIDKIDTQNSVKTQELTSDDQQTLMANLQKSKLYELIENFIGGNTLNLMDSSTTMMDDNEEDNNDTNNDYNWKEEDDNRDKDDKAKTKGNEIITYDGKEKITFRMPSGYKSNYVSDNYKSIEKGNIAIKVSTAYGNKDEYYEDLQEKKQYFEKEANYRNVILSEIKTMQVNERTFYHAEFSYEYAGGGYTTTYKTTYMWSELSDENVIDFEIQNIEDITSEELKEILTLKVEKK